MSASTQKLTSVDLWQFPLIKKSLSLQKAAQHDNPSECTYPHYCSGRPFSFPDEDFVDHVEHANAKLLWHWREPWGGAQSGLGVREPLLPSRLHGRAAELEIF